MYPSFLWAPQKTPQPAFIPACALSLDCTGITLQYLPLGTLYLSHFLPMDFSAFMCISFMDSPQPLWFKVEGRGC